VKRDVLAPSRRWGAREPLPVGNAASPSGLPDCSSCLSCEKGVAAGLPPGAAGAPGVACAARPSMPRERKRLRSLTRSASQPWLTLLSISCVMKLLLGGAPACEAARPGGGQEAPTSTRYWGRGGECGTHPGGREAEVGQGS
jgi:hypothetical protein